MSITRKKLIIVQGSGFNVQGYEIRQEFRAWSATVPTESEV